MLRMIEEIYSKTVNEILTLEGVTDSFGTVRGVRQGCPLSPTLFNIFSDDMEQVWENKNIGGTVIGKTKIFCLKFADDLALVSDTAEGLSEMIKTLESYGKKIN